MKQRQVKIDCYALDGWSNVILYRYLRYLQAARSYIRDDVSAAIRSSVSPAPPCQKENGASHDQKPEQPAGPEEPAAITRIAPDYASRLRQREQ